MRAGRRRNPCESPFICAIVAVNGRSEHKAAGLSGMLFAAIMP
jgi:hypothetical protein